MFEEWILLQYVYQDPFLMDPWKPVCSGHFSEPAFPWVCNTLYFSFILNVFILSTI